MLQAIYVLTFWKARKIEKLFQKRHSSRDSGPQFKNKNPEKDTSEVTIDSNSSYTASRKKRSR